MSSVEDVGQVADQLADAASQIVCRFWLFSRQFLEEMFSEVSASR